MEEIEKHVVLWTKSPNIIYQNVENTAIIFNGQICGKRDNLIQNAIIVCSGDEGKRQYMGDVLSVTEINKEETRRFIIVIVNSKDNSNFKTKNTLSSYLGLSACDDQMPGITLHTDI
jgi:hypothetical protein